MTYTRGPVSGFALQLFCPCGVVVGYKNVSTKEQVAECHVFCSKKCLAEYMFNTPIEKLGLDLVEAPLFQAMKNVPTDLDVQPTLTVTPHGDS